MYHEEVKDHILHDHPERADVVATIDPSSFRTADNP